MKPSDKIYRTLLVSAAIISLPAWLSGCASSGADATVKNAEKLVAAHPVAKAKQTRPKSKVPEAPAEGPAWALSAPGMGPGPERTDRSKKHLLELYAGQQAIIESLEANTRSREPGGFAGDEEGHASDLPEDISQEDLLRILGQQQKLIKALTAQRTKHVRH